MDEKSDRKELQRRLEQAKRMAAELHPVRLTPALANPACLSYSMGTRITDRRMPAFRIVEALNIIEHVGLGLVP